MPREEPLHGDGKVTNIRDLENICIFDTSAVNALLDDSNRESIIRGLRQFTVFPTVVAVSELSATPDQARRFDLIRLLKEIGGENLPLASPNKLIIRLSVAYHMRDESPCLNDGEEERMAWTILNRPEIVDAEAQEVAMAFHREQEAVFRVMWGQMRLEMGEAPIDGRPRSLANFVSRFREDRAVYVCVNEVYRRSTGHDLPREQLRMLLSAIPHWDMFLFAYAYAAYQQVVQEQYGRRNPGQFDLWSATYLPSCDFFVTNDRRQWRALRFVNRFGSRPASVLRYSDFTNQFHKT